MYSVRTLCAALAFLGCAVPVAAGPETSSTTQVHRAVIANYAAIAAASYADATAGAEALAMAIDAFLAAPDEVSLARARTAWRTARVPYVQTEAFRFYDGPIDAVEGRINSWPIDENLIDYVEDDAAAGIVNHADKFPVIDERLIVSLNEKDGEKNITAGFHAIEFLLWGQDLNDDGPGARPASDFQDQGSPHAMRRREYLRIASHLLAADVRSVSDEWANDRPGNYRERFLAMPSEQALALIVKGLGILSGAELAGERLTVPYETKEQEDEHSCFSDNTHDDFVGDAQGIENVVLGRLTRLNGDVISGPGLRDVIAQRDRALADTLSAQVSASVAAARAVPAPFDRAILGTDTAAGRIAVKALIAALRAQADSLARAAAALGLQVNF